MKAYVWHESRQDHDSSPCSAKHLAKNRTKPINNLENNFGKKQHLGTKHGKHLKKKNCKRNETKILENI